MDTNSRKIKGVCPHYLLATLLITLAPGGGAGAEAGDEPPRGPEPVVLLHGLARSAASMESMEQALNAAGFQACNVGYPSRHHPIATLARDFVAPEIASCFPDSTVPIHFVTHSLGGIIFRQLVASGAFTRVGRVVMLSPPNQGSEVVDTIGNLWLFRVLNGPAGQEMGTDPDSVPLQLGPAQFEAGIITGTRSINPLLSLMIPGPDDGKVAVEHAKLGGMKDFLALPVSHPFIMNNTEAIRQTIRFLKSGSFEH